MSTETSANTNVNATVEPTIADELYLIMQIGIEGGLGPSVATHRWIVTRAPLSDNMMISYKEKPHGAYYLEDKITRTLKVEQHAASIARLLELLAEIPTQYPGAEDLYGRNTSIVHAIKYVNRHELDRYGTAAAMGVPQPTEEQKVKFKEAIDIIASWTS